MTNPIIARCQTATEAEQREVLKACFVHLFGEKPPRAHGGSLELAEWLRKHNPFYCKLDASAYVDAALLIMREVLPGWRRVAREESDHFFVRIHSPDFDSVTWGKGENWITDVLTGREASAKASTEALAILSAILTAKENENG